MKLRHFAVVFAGLVSGSLCAGPSELFPGPPQPKDTPLLDQLWNLPRIYHHDDNPLIEEFDLMGRYQQDYFNVDSDRGSTSFFEIRRLRLGADSFYFRRHLELEAEVDTALRTYNSPSVFYNRMTNLWARIAVSDAFNIRFGKFQAHFGYDREFSPNYMRTFERGFFDDQLIGTNDYVSGVEATGNIGHFGYLAHIYSTNVNKELGRFDGGQAYQAEVSYDFADVLRARRALWVVDYLHADGKNANTNVFANYRHAFATYFDLEKGRFSMVPQFAVGQQIAGKGDVYSLQIMPGYMITDRLEFLVRYQYGTATEPNGIVTLNRQQRTLGNFTGDTYNAVYLGLNYYIYGHRLKLMFGEEYARLAGGTGAQAGYNGWTTLVGLRLFF
jgi:hypothetical protein